MIALPCGSTEQLFAALLVFQCRILQKYVQQTPSISTPMKNDTNVDVG